MASLDWSSRKDLEGNFSVLTGFRGVAILWVVFAHLPLALPELIERFQHRWGIGVDAFLAVSGFLVTRSLYQSDLHASRQGKGTWAGAREFAVRRLARILPPYYATALVIAALAFVEPNVRAKMAEIVDILPSFLLFFSNYTIPGSAAAVPTFLIMTWSLAYQEQFYAVMVALYVFSRRHLSALILAVTLASALYRLYMVFFGWDSVSSHTLELGMWLHLRFDAVGWSALAWIHFDRLQGFWSTPGRARFCSALAVSGLAAVLAAHTFLPGDVAQALIYCFKGPVLAAVVLSLVHYEKSLAWPARFLRQRWLGILGVSAYEIYLLNTLVIVVTTRLPFPNQLAFAIASVVISVAAGVVYYRIFGRWTKRVFRSAFGVRAANPRAIAG